MRKIWNKGHRIRASDKHLVYHFSIGMLLVVFVAVLLLLNIKQLMRTDWEHFSLLENGLTLSPYNFITILIATGVCALVAFLYYRFCYDSFKKLLHRQKLARMVLENKWYEADTVQDSGFFTDRQSRSREKIGCEYISDLPSYKRKVWHEMKRLNHADYEERQLEDFSKYVFGMSYQTLKDVIKQQKGREEQCRKQGCWWKREEQLAKKQHHTGSTCR